MPFPFAPSPSTLRTLHRDGKVGTCEVRFVQLGKEARETGRCVISRIFSTGDKALAWGEGKRRECLARGSL